MRTLIAVAVLTSFVSSQQTTAVDVSYAARTLQPGELVLVTVDPHTDAGGVHVRALDRDWPAHPSGDGRWQAIVGIDLATKPGKYPVNVRVDAASGVRRGSVTLPVEAKTFPVRKLTVDPSFVTPPASAQERIAREAAELSRLWRTLTPAPHWAGGFRKPVPHNANSAFGARSIFNGQPRSQHTGADFASPAGTPVEAPAAGRVLLAGDLYYTGGTVMIDHGGGLISLFAHLSAIDTKTNADVSAGDVIGRVGATGRVTGPHLHWTLRVTNVSVDPVSALHVLGSRKQAPRP